MNDLDQGFDRLLGRRPTEGERQHLYRVRDALGLANNDALWLVLVALEHYDTLFRQYPEKLATSGVALLESQRAALAEAVAAEAGKVQRTLADAVVSTATDLAHVKAEHVRWRAVALAAAGMVTFGSLCVTCGYLFGAGQTPPWAAPPTAPLSTRLLAALLGAPAGWTVFAILLPVASSYGLAGWRLYRGAHCHRSEQASGLLLALGAFVAVGSSIAVLVRVVGWP